MRKVIIDTYGASNVLTYNPITDRLLRASDRVIATEKRHQAAAERLASTSLLFPLAKAGLAIARKIQSRNSFEVDDLPDDFRVITGHFSGAKFEDVLPPEAAEYISVLRDPLKRTKSHFEHWKRSHGLAQFRIMVPFDSKMEFNEFAFLPELQNYQAQAIGMALSEYRLVGTLDYLSEFMEELGLVQSEQEVPNFNRGHYNRTSNYSPDFVSRFEEFHNQDYELFQAVQDRWQ